MRPDVFGIEFLKNNSRPVGYYVAGETINGVVHVIIGASQICRCKGITITVRGKAAFRRNVPIGLHGAQVPQDKEEIYLDSTLSLLGAGGREEISLSPGNYDYPFGFTLPPDLPSTLVTSSGSIAYEMRVEMFMGSSESNHAAGISFHVSSVVDLNLAPFEHFAASPVQMEKYKTLCCCCCESGPLGFSMTVTRGGYALGENIQFTAEFTNRSDTLVEFVTASLVQKVIYKLGPYGEQHGLTDIFSAQGPSVEPGSIGQIWTVNDFPIPRVVAPTSTKKSILEVHYLLQIEMHLFGTAISSNLKHEIPFLIGTVPLRSPPT